MWETYKDTLTIDRIDNNGDYSKDNCRWATRLIQNNNTRANTLIEYNGESHTIPVWATKLWIKRSTLSMRYYVYKRPIEKVLTTK